MKLVPFALLLPTLACGRVDPAAEPSELACGQPTLDPHVVIPERERPRPDLGRWHTDPALGGCVARVTDHDQTPDLDSLRVTPTRQAWNSDSSRILLASGHVLDASSFSTLAEVPAPAVWDPQRPDALYYVEENQLVRRDLSQATEEVAASFDEYSELDSKRLGDVSDDGRRIALVGLRKGDGVPEIFVWDLESGVKSPTLAAPLDFVHRATAPRWVTVSPLGGSVVIAWPDAGDEAFRGIELFDAKLQRKGQLSSDTGDADVTVDSNGTEWLIDESDGEHGPVVKKTPLAAGAPSQRLLELEWFHNVRISCRAPGSGVCVLSTQGDPSGEWRAFANEVFALSLDSTPEAPLVSRLAHHHSAPDFVSKQPPSACPVSPNSVLSSPTSSRDGRLALFTSNWSSHCFGELYLIQR